MSRFEIGVASWTVQSTYMSPRPFADLYQEVIHHAALAENLGFDSFDIGEHHHGYDGYLPSSMALASAVLARTSQIKASLAVLLLPLHGPRRVAEAVAAINSFARGRLRLINGLGWRNIEYDASGVDRRQRGRLMDAYSEALFDGPYADRISGTELWFGGGADAMIRRAARFGASFCHTFSPVDALQNRIELWRSELGAVRRGQPDPKNTLTIDIWVDRNAERREWMRQRMREPWRFYTEMDSLPKDITGSPIGVDETIDMLNSYSIIASPEDAVDQLAPYVRIADGLVCRLWCDGVETALVDECMTLIATEVAPKLRKLK